MFSRIYGNGQPLIIIHGLFGMSDNWNSLGKIFSKNYNVHLVDLRNHGRSFHDEIFTFEAISKDLKNYITHHNLEKPIILGHSLGGKVAMHFCFKNKSLVSKLIVVDIAPKTYNIDFHRNILSTLIDLQLNTFKSRNEIDLALSSSIKDSAIRFFLMKNIYRNASGFFAWRFNIKVLLNKIENIQDANFLIGTINTPTLFIKGTKSDYITKEDELLIQNHFNNVIIKEIQNSGHWVHAEQTNLFNKEVLNFL
jgi:esterase